MFALSGIDVGRSRLKANRSIFDSVLLIISFACYMFSSFRHDAGVNLVYFVLNYDFSQEISE
jgi:hypothetical protein